MTAYERTTKDHDSCIKNNVKVTAKFTYWTIYI